MQKEFIHTLRDRRTLAILLGMPMIQLFLFGVAINMDVDHIPMAVADQSLDAASRAYVEAMVTSGYFDAIAYVASQAEVVRAIDKGRAQAGMVIPPDFGPSVERGDAQVLFLVDGSDLLTSQSAYNAATSVAQAHAAQVLAARVMRSGAARPGGERLVPGDRHAGRGSKHPLDVRMRILYNPNLLDLWFVIPGMAAMILQTQSIALTAAAVVREREMGTIEQLLVTPITPGELMLGKVAPNLIIAMINMLTILAIGVLGFGVPFRGSFWLFCSLSFIYVFSGLGLGLLISTVTKNHRQAQQLGLMIMLIGLILGGFMFPREPMPLVLRLLGNLFPLTYFIPISRGIISKGVGIQFLWEQVAALSVYVVLIMAVASRAFKRGLD